MTFQIEGIIPAMVTPVTVEGKTNTTALRKLTNYLIEGGVHGLFPVGSQGGFYALTFEEKKIVIEVVVEEAGGRVPVYAGTGAVTTREAVALTQMAEAAGVAAVSVITPYFISPSEAELCLQSPGQQEHPYRHLLQPLPGYCIGLVDSERMRQERKIKSALI